MYERFIIGNESILSILLASIFLLTFPFLDRIENKKAYYIVRAIFVLICLYVFFETKGRAGLVGFCAGNFLLNNSVVNKKHKKPLLAPIIVIGFLFTLCYIKPDSSFGRLLIYKISATIFNDHLLWGIGLGEFKVQYNLYQADYFSTHSIDSTESLLADNTFYAFNDLWQLVIELGVIRFAGLALSGFVLLRYLRTYKIKPQKKQLFYAASSALLCIMVASLFSYPFQVFVIQLAFLVYLFLLSLSVESSDESSFCSQRWLLGSQVTFFVSIMLLSTYGLYKISLIARSEEAFQLYQAGFKAEALSKYSTTLKDAFVKESTDLHAYARQLYNANRLEDAKGVLEEAKRRYVDNETYKLSAALAYESGNFQDAERNYLTAVFMVPNRMSSRYELYNFYLNTRDTLKALYWAHSILYMPVKVPSQRTESMQRIVKENIANLTSYKIKTNL